MSGPASPLAELEDSVRAVAERSAVPLDDRGSADRIRALVEDQLDTWRRQHREGRRPRLGDTVGLADRAVRNLAGYGPLDPLLADEDVWEIMVNAPDPTLA